MRLRLLVNPTAGRGRAIRTIGRVIRVLTARGCAPEVKISASSEHLIQLAADPENEQFDRLVICGGDGTLNLAVRQLDLERVTLGIIPLGSGDDIAKTLGIPSDLEGACEIILRGTTRTVDVAEANGVRYLGVAGIGFDSLVAAWVNENTSFFRGSLLYVYGILRLLPRFRPLRIIMTIDGVSTVEELMFAVVGNSHRYGGGIAIAPDARIDDGKLNAYLIGRCSRFDLLTTLPLTYSGNHVKRRFVRMVEGTRFEIDAERPLDLFADGEKVATTPVVVTLARERLTVAAPLPMGEGVRRV